MRFFDINGKNRNSAIAGLLTCVALLSNCWPLLANRNVPASKAPSPVRQFEEVSRVPLPYGAASAVQVVGSLAYLANGVGGLLIVDISRPAQPRLLGRYITGNTTHESIGREWIQEYKGSATAIDVAGHFAYLLTQSSGYDLGRSKVLQIDISNPVAPTLRSEYLLFDKANDIKALDPNTVCIARNTGGDSFPPNLEGTLSVLDFSEPGRARIVGSLPPPPGIHTAFGHLALSGNTAFVVGTEQGAAPGRLFVVDLTNRTKPALLATMPTKGASLGLAPAPDGKMLYIADGAAGVSVVDVAERTKPQITGSLAVDAARAVALHNGRLEILTNEGIAVYELRHAAAPRRVSVTKYPSDAAALAASSTALAIADEESGLIVFTAAGDNAPQYAGRFLSKGEALRLHQHGNRLWVADGAGGTLTFDVANPHEPRLTASTPAEGMVLDVGTSGASSVVVDTGLGLSVPQSVSSRREPPTHHSSDREQRVFVAGSTAYAAVAGLGLRIYEITDGHAPVLRGELKLPRDDRITPRGIFVQDKVAYLVTGRDGLRTIDVSDPAHPVLLGRFYDSVINRMATADVVVNGHMAYLADLDNGLYVVDVTDPRQPRQVAHYHTGNAHSVAIEGNLAVTADGIYGAHLFDISDPQHLRHLGAYYAPRIKFNSAIFAPRLKPTDPPTLLVADAGCLRTFILHPEVSPDLRYGSPRLVSHVKLPMGIPDVLRVSDDGLFAYAASDEGWNLAIYDISQLSAPRFRNAAATSGFAHGLTVRGRYAFVCNNYDACTIFDTSDPDHPRLVSAVMPLEGARMAQVQGDALFISTKDGIICVDISDLEHPAIKSTYKGIGSDFGILSAAGKRYLLGAGEGGWQVVDVSDLARPSRVGLLPGEGFGSTTTAGDAICVGKTTEVPAAAGKKRIAELLTIKLDGTQPRIVGRVEIPGGVGRLDAHGRYAYSGGGLLSVIDIGDVANPMLVSQLQGERNEGTYGDGTPQFSDVRPFVRDGKDYVAAVDIYWGLRLYDATDKKDLREIGDFGYSGGDFTGIQTIGERTYVGNNWGGVYIVDTADPLHPKLLGGTRRMLKPNRGSVGHFVVGSTLYFQGNTDRVLRIADVTDAAQPKLLGQFPLPKEGQTGDDRRFGSTFPQLRDKYLYTPGFARIFDVSDPHHPQLVGEAKDVGFTNDTCALTEIAGRSYLIVGSQDGLKVVDVADPAHPQLVGVAPGDYQGGYYFGRGLQVDGAIAYVTDRYQLDIVDLSNPRLPRRLSSIEIGGTTNDVKVVNGIAYVIGYFDGLQMIDVRDPKNPRPIDHFQEGVYWDAAAWDNLACCQNIDIAGGYAYVSEYYSGLLVIRLDDQ